MSTAGQRARGREWATRVVQWDPARNALKRNALRFARARGKMLEATGRVPEIAHLYAASSPKAGSQWMKALLDHPVVRAQTRLFSVPQLDYQSHPERGFPAGTFVPGLYMSHPEYLRIPHRHQHRVVYMFRDPREIVVSGYFSAIGGHRNTQIEEIERDRQRMRDLPLAEGLLFAIGTAETRLREMATWIDTDDEHVATFRLEDVGSDTRTQVSRILQHCGVDLADDEFDVLLRDVSRDALQARDIAQRSDASQSHYRVERKSFRELFTSDHLAAVEEIVPGLAARLGYDDE